MQKEHEDLFSVNAWNQVDGKLSKGCYREEMQRPLSAPLIVRLSSKTDKQKEKADVGKISRLSTFKKCTAQRNTDLGIQKKISDFENWIFLPLWCCILRGYLLSQEIVLTDTV